MTTRMFPKSGNTTAQTAAHGRVVSAALGFSDVADHDSKVLQANGWVRAGLVGTTSQRPAAGANTQGDQFIDTTLSAVIVWDGIGWRNMVSGAAV